MSRRKIIWVAVALVLSGIGIGYWRYSVAHRVPPARFETNNVEKGPLIAKVTATGTLSALVTVQVGTQVSGRIAKIFVDYNSPVKQNQLIAKIDPRLFQAAVEQAQANLLAAQGNLDKSKAQAVDSLRQLERAKALAQQKLIAQADLDTAQANYDSGRATVVASQAALAQARASLNQARINLDYTDIISPINGVIISRNVDVGQTVAASLQAPVLFTIAEDLKKMQVDTSVAESDVGKLQPDMIATFTVDAFPSERFEGRIRQIRNAPQTVQNVVTYDAVIDVDNTLLKLKPGMTASVSVIYAERANALKIPNAALRYRPTSEALEIKKKDGAASGSDSRSGTNGRRSKSASLATSNQGASPSTATVATTPNHRKIWVLRDNVATPISVRVGVTDGTNTEIVEGELKEGDAVITDAINKSDSGPKRSPGPMKRLF